MSANRPDHLLPAPLKSAPLPEVTNHTPWPSQYFQHVDPRGEIFHVMVCRTSYSLRGMDFDGSATPRPHLLAFEDQLPLCEADVFCDGANTSSALQESDFAPYKPRCDVLLINAQAHAPEGHPARRWPVGLNVGSALQKLLQACGPRALQRSVTTLGTWRLGEPDAVTSVPLVYERAFGGPSLLQAQERLEALAADSAEPPERRQQAQDALIQIPKPYLPNPIGCGRDTQTWLKVMLRLEALTGTKIADAQPLAPQIEELNRPYAGEDDYPVLGFGPVGRWWQPRLKLAGTHDEAWKASQWPKSPQDHDYRYWNCAPEDQQIDYPQGGELVSLLNLTPRGGVVRFELPRQDLQLLVRLHVGALMFAPMNIDTVIVDVGNATLSVVRRALISARTEVRALELGTWPKGTAMELPAAPEEAHG
ncbi:MAG: DUF2169 domain-containing protein [Rubrivivax sp.]